MASFRDDGLEGHILLAILCKLSSSILLLVVAFCTPYIQSLAFLSVASDVHFGSLGYCVGTACYHQVGYAYGPEIIPWLLKAMILFPLAGVFEGLSLVLLFLVLWDRATYCSHHMWYRGMALFGTVLSVLGLIFALILWVTAYNRFNDEGYSATYGATLWIAIAGTAAGILGLCVGGPKYNGNHMYRAHPSYAYHL